MTKLVPTRGGARLTLEPAEVAALGDLAGQLAATLGGGVPEHGTDPIRDRLFPRAYVDPTEDRAEAEFQSVVHEDLVRTKSDALAALVAELDGDADSRGRMRFDLDASTVAVWIAALNDIRLAVGVALGITEDDDDVPDTHPQAQAHATYHWLTYLQGALIEVLLEE